MVTHAGRLRGQSLSSALPGCRAQAPCWGAGSWAWGSVPAPQRRPGAEGHLRFPVAVPQGPAA